MSAKEIDNSSFQKYNNLNYIYYKGTFDVVSKESELLYDLRRYHWIGGHIGR